MYKKKVFISCILFLSIVCLTACDMTVENKTPQIEASFTFSTLSDANYKNVGGTKNKVKEDFRNVHFSVTVKNSANIADRKISIPDLKDAMNSYDIERYWYGEYTSIDSPTEDAEYTNDVMFYSKGLTEEKIKAIFEDSKVVVKWTSEDGKEEMRTINLSEIIVFE